MLKGTKHKLESVQKIKEKRKLQICTFETKLKMSQSQKGKKKNISKDGRKQLQENGRKVGQFNKGRIRSESERKAISEGHKSSKSHFWKGGVTSKTELLRVGLEMKVWREKIFKRDNFTCQKCGQRGKKLNADHIKPVAMFPELRFDLDNGRTLCFECHKKTDTWGSKTNKLKYGVVYYKL
jgi:hypothetical protein